MCCRRRRRSFSAARASIAASIRGRSPATTPLRRPLPGATSLQLYGFLDWGETWERSDDDADHVLSSTGGGARFFVTPYTEFDVEGVARLTRHINGADASELKGEAVYWRALVRF